VLSVYPNYYPKFHCIAGACRHNCCIGWEIDIDAETASSYTAVSGKFGDRLRRNIADEDPPHFVLDEKERCPFLNAQNLCDIILTLGEENLCQICTDHPRFRNELPDRTEIGIGLCCEEAARLILGQQEKMVLIGNNQICPSDAILLKRDQVIPILQNRDQTLLARIDAMLQFTGVKRIEKSIDEWIDFLLHLERLDNDWTRVLLFLKENERAADHIGFDQFMKARQTEYEQFIIYLIYRHLANAVDEEDFAVRLNFSIFGFFFLHAIGAAIWTKTGDFTFFQQCELARLFSSEIEYSEENFELLLEEIYWDLE